MGPWAKSPCNSRGEAMRGGAGLVWSIKGKAWANVATHLPGLMRRSMRGLELPLVSVDEKAS